MSTSFIILLLSFVSLGLIPLACLACLLLSFIFPSATATSATSARESACTA